MNLPDALAAATEIQQILAPNCLHCEIAGSIRRLKPEGIKDIEIVIVPTTAGLPHLHKIINSY